MKRASTAPVSAARLGVHTVAPWGGGLVVILDPVAPGACRVTKPGSGNLPAARPMRSGIRSHQAAGAWPCALFPRPPCLLLLGRLRFSSGLRRAVPRAWPPLLLSASSLRSQGDLGSAQQLQGVWTREIRRKQLSCVLFSRRVSKGSSPPPPPPMVQRPGPRIVQESGEERATGPAQVWPKTGAQQMPPHFPLSSNHM